VKIPGKRNNLDDFSELPVIIPKPGKPAFFIENQKNIVKI
jgi:hypothetical protein